MNNKFNLGDKIWLATCRWAEKQITCPDCFGQRYLKVILGNNTEVTVECPTCSRGYEGSKGSIGSYDYIPEVEFYTVEGVEKSRRDGESFEYRSGNRCGFHEEDMFFNVEAARIRAQQLALEQVRTEVLRLQQKERPNKSWAWNATYHRGEIRRMEKDLIYHRAKLTVAEAHKKEEKAAESVHKLN